jgi:glycosyltransferase involved in cell wall biosynthesis
LPKTSIILPVYNEAENIHLLYEELGKVCNTDTEFIFVDDGSKDNTFREIHKLAEGDPRIKCLSLSRNFGHQNALMAGMEKASGDVIVLMDADLQHPPALLPEMFQKIDDGFDLVITKRKSTVDINPIKQFFSLLFYKFINAISETKIEPKAADFRAFNRKVLESVLQFKERDLFLRGIFSWIGFRSTTLTFDAPARQFGKTKYSFATMMRLAWKGTTSFSFKPLRIALLFGSLLSLASFAFGAYALLAYFRGETIPGWASLIIAVMILGGTQLLAIGLLGEYIAKLFTESKKRPRYLIKDSINIE